LRALSCPGLLLQGVSGYLSCGCIVPGSPHSDVTHHVTSYAHDKLSTPNNLTNPEQSAPLCAYAGNPVLT